MLKPNMFVCVRSGNSLEPIQCWIAFTGAHELARVAKKRMLFVPDTALQAPGETRRRSLGANMSDPRGGSARSTPRTSCGTPTVISIVTADRGM